MLPSIRSAMLAQPSQGQRYLPGNLDFTDSTALAEEISLEGYAGNFDFLQSVYIDNSQNPNDLAITFEDGSSEGYRLAIQASTQGWYPAMIPAGAPIRYTASTSQGYVIPIKFTNHAMPYFVWPSAIIGTVNADLTPIVGNFTDKGVALTGGDQTIMAINAARKRMIISNPATNNNVVYVNFGAAATAGGDSIPLYPGNTFDSGSGPVSGQAVHVLGTAADTLIAKEM